MTSDITALDVKLLLAFDALMEARSVTQAARRLDMTQQGVSGLLRRLRALFSDPLFVRESRGVTPTPRAEELAPLVKSALAGLEAVLQSAPFDPVRAEDTVCVATSDYGLSTLIVPLYRELQILAPGLRLAVLPRNTESLADDMRRGEVDLALTIPAFAPPNLFTLRLFEERYRCAVGADHPLAGAPVDLDAFCAHRHLLVSPDGGATIGPTDIALARLERTRRIGLTVPSYSAVAEVLESTDLITVLPARILARLDARLYTFPPPSPLRIEGFQMIAAWPERVDADPLQRWFRGLCEEFARTLR